jgi:hypothetical protein
LPSKMKHRCHIATAESVRQGSKGEASVFEAPEGGFCHRSPKSTMAK